MPKDKALVDGFIDLASNNHSGDDGFITVEEEESLVEIRFFKLDEEMKTKEIIASVKKGNTISIINISAIMDEPSHIRIFVNKIRRISDDYSITMKLYGKNWLLILPEHVSFKMGEE